MEHRRNHILYCLDLMPQELPDLNQVGLQLALMGVEAFGNRSINLPAEE
jgi:hypothetical protein